MCHESVHSIFLTMKHKKGRKCRSCKSCFEVSWGYFRISGLINCWHDWILLSFMYVWIHHGIWHWTIQNSNSILINVFHDAKQWCKGKLWFVVRSMHQRSIFFIRINTCELFWKGRKKARTRHQDSSPHVNTGGNLTHSNT